MAPESGLQERPFVGEILIQGSDRDSGPHGDLGRGQPLLAGVSQNLNSGFEKRVHAGGGTRLDRRFTRLQSALRTAAQMRTPERGLSSSNHWRRYYASDEPTGRKPSGRQI